jgi:hypothetical protein
VRLALTNDDLRFPKTIAGDDEWNSFKRDSFDRFVRRIKEIDAATMGLAERQRDLRALRREHHVLIVADRIRRKFRSTSEAVPLDLGRAAELVIDKAQLLGNLTGLERTIEEQRYLTSARVSWHKLIKLADVRPVERRGVAGVRLGREIRSGSTNLRRLKNERLRPHEKGEILQRYISEHLQHLVAVADDASKPDDPPLPRENRLLIRELKTLLRRAQKEPHN